MVRDRTKRTIGETDIILILARETVTSSLEGAKSLPKASASKVCTRQGYGQAGKRLATVVGARKERPPQAGPPFLPGAICSATPAIWPARRGRARAPLGRGAVSRRRDRSRG